MSNSAKKTNYPRQCCTACSSFGARVGSVRQSVLFLTNEVHLRALGLAQTIVNFPGVCGVPA
jgi:hypothetical protein